LIDDAAATVKPACRAVGPARLGESCTNSACEKGALCVNGVCQKLCCGGDWTACPAGESCIRQLQAETKQGVRLDAQADLCMKVNDCDVFDASSCAADNRICRIADPTGNVACMPYSNLQLGDPCNEQSQCGAGMHCVGSSSGPTRCRRLCRWEPCGTPSCLASEGVCVHFDRDPPGVGECTPNWHGSPVKFDGGLPARTDGG